MGSSNHPLLAAIVEANRLLADLQFAEPVSHIYNPLEYALDAHLEYLQRFGSGRKKTLFLGMNPGPFGMVQTGVPFGEVSWVRDWFGIRTPPGQPETPHPKRPVDGFDCSRSEVSGQRLWSMIAERFGNVEAFFADAIVVNYCPLVWMRASGSNITPDKLPRQEIDPVYAICDRLLAANIDYYQPKRVVAIGAFVEKRMRQFLLSHQRHKDLSIGRMLHPSPASPIANREWPQRAIDELVAMGVWD